MRCCWPRSTAPPVAIMLLLLVLAGGAPAVQCTSPHEVSPVAKSQVLAFYMESVDSPGVDGSILL